LNGVLNLVETGIIVYSFGVVSFSTVSFIVSFSTVSFSAASRLGVYAEAKAV
jgi:hypothetical protein